MDMKYRLIDWNTNAEKLFKLYPKLQENEMCCKEVKGYNSMEIEEPVYFISTDWLKDKLSELEINIITYTKMLIKLQCHKSRTLDESYWNRIIDIVKDNIKKYELIKKIYGRENQ